MPSSNGASSSSAEVGNNGGVGGGSSSQDDEDTEVAGHPPNPDFEWEDAELRVSTLNALNHMRRTRHFCDVTLQVSKIKIFSFC